MGVESGTDDFLTKPVNKLELITRVKSLLRVRHLKRELDRTMAYIQDIQGRSQGPPGGPGGCGGRRAGRGAGGVIIRNHGFDVIYGNYLPSGRRAVYSVYGVNANAAEDAA